MNRKITILILVVAFFSAISYFYLVNTNKTATTNDTVKREDSQLINKVIEVEKNIVLTQLRQISFNDFKDNTSSFFHTYYKDPYFNELENIYNKGGDIATSTLLPLYMDISKVYTSKDSSNKYIYIKIADERLNNQAAELYTFIKDNDEWKIRLIKHYVLSKDMKTPEKDVEKFINFNGETIKYESIKIVE